MKLADLAGLVADDINAQSWAESFDAQKTYSPSYLLENLESSGLQVEIVPAKFIPSRLSRSFVSCEYNIQIAIIEKLIEDNSQTVRKDALEAFCEEISIFFDHRKYGGNKCVSAIYDPLFFPDVLKKQKCFLGVVSLIFRGQQSI